VPGYCVICREQIGGQKRSHHPEEDSDEQEQAAVKVLKRNEDPDLNDQPCKGANIAIAGGGVGAQVEDLWFDDDQLDSVLEGHAVGIDPSQVESLFRLLDGKQEIDGVLLQQVEDLQSDFGNATNDENATNPSSVSPVAPFINVFSSSVDFSDTNVGPSSVSTAVQFGNPTPSPSASDDWSLFSPSGTAAVEVNFTFCCISTLPSLTVPHLYVFCQCSDLISLIDFSSFRLHHFDQHLA